MINNPLSYSNKSWPHSSNNNQWRNFNCTLVADHVDHMGEFWRIKYSYRRICCAFKSDFMHYDF